MSKNRSSQTTESGSVDPELFSGIVVEYPDLHLSVSSWEEAFGMRRK
jgi:hypothetical protein